MKYYLDTEFNGHLGELISLALVSDDGRELYLSNIDRLENDVDWVRNNVITVLCAPDAIPMPSNCEQISYDLEKFFAGDEHPTVVVDWPDDIKYLCEALITGPGEMIKIPRLTFELARVDAYPTAVVGAVQHNALWDARALKAKLQRQSLPPGVYQR